MRIREDSKLYKLQMTSRMEVRKKWVRRRVYSSESDEYGNRYVSTLEFEYSEFVKYGVIGRHYKSKEREGLKDWLRYERTYINVYLDTVAIDRQLGIIRKRMKTPTVIERLNVTQKIRDKKMLKKYTLVEG